MHCRYFQCSVAHCQPGLPISVAPAVPDQGNFMAELPGLFLVASSRVVNIAQSMYQYKDKGSWQLELIHPLQTVRPDSPSCLIQNHPSIHPPRSESSFLPCFAFHSILCQQNNQTLFCFLLPIISSCQIDFLTSPSVPTRLNSNSPNFYIARRHPHQTQRLQLTS